MNLASEIRREWELIQTCSDEDAGYATLRIIGKIPAIADALEENERLKRDSIACQRCGRPTVFEFTVASPYWNEFVRANGHPEYICFWCFDELAAVAGRKVPIPIGINLSGVVAFSSWCGDDVPGAYNEPSTAQLLADAECEAEMQTAHAFALQSEVAALQRELAEARELLDHALPFISNTVLADNIDKFRAKGGKEPNADL